MTTTPIWLDKQIILEIHHAVITASGGSHGTRDDNLLESALVYPQHLFAYKQVNLFELAAGYAEAIVRNHPFIDGNKRTAFVAADVFLDVNGYDITIHTEILVEMMLDLVEKRRTQADIAEILEKHSTYSAP